MRVPSGKIHTLGPLRRVGKIFCHGIGDGCALLSADGFEKTVQQLAGFESMDLNKMSQKMED